MSTTWTIGSQNQTSELKNYSLPGVISFLGEHCKQIEIERTHWLVEKKQLTERIAQLEGENKSQDNIVKDLTRRIKMLEYSLRQERIKYAKLTGGHHRVNSDVITSILSRDDKNGENSGNSLPKRRTRAHRQLLSKYLQELGLDDIFTGDLPPRPSAHHRPSKSYGSGIQALIEAPEVETKPIPKPDVIKSNSLTEEKIKRSWELKATLKSHMDGVRSVYFAPKNGILATSSEDCVIKLWDISNYETLNESSFFEPYFTLRGHKGPIFCSTGNQIGNEQLLYTAGKEGNIRVWDLRPPSEIDTYNPGPDRGCCVGVWASHSEPIWDLQHHPLDNLLLSVSSDGVTKLWKTMDTRASIENWELGRASSNLLKNYTFPTNDGDEFHIPTCCAWVMTELNSFVVGYTSPFLNIFDKQTGKPTIIKFVKDQNAPSVTYQINSIVTDPNHSLAVSGHEDKHLRFFDLNSCTCVKDLVGHTESVSSLLMDKYGNYVISGGHDGSLRFWDMRNYQCLHEIPAHRKKYDEGVFSIAQHQNLPILASGGADSLVKFYHASDD